MVETRDEIRAHVEATPGIHFSRLRRDLGLATGQTQYHLRTLTRDGRLVAEEVAGRTHYYEPTVDPWERCALAFLRRETARAIIVRLHADGSAKPCDLAAELGLARSTVSWHVSNLADNDVVERSDARPMTVSLARPERTARLLETASPSLPDRVVDRFVRTVDELLDGR